MDNVPVPIPSAGMDAAEVKRLWGAPDSVHEWRNIMDDLDLTWNYPSLEVYFTFDRVFGVRITAPGRATVRGVQVGDSIRDLYRLYGRPLKVDGEFLVYGQILFTVQHGLVHQIYSEERHQPVPPSQFGDLSQLDFFT